MKEKIVITGGSGLVGKHLTSLLVQSGYEVAHIGRKSYITNGLICYEWNIDKGYIDPKALENTGYIIHLAGAGVADKRWTDARKKEIYESRIQSTRLLVNYLNQTPHQVKALIGTSAIGIYGNDTNNANENSPAASTFLGKVCSDWESETLKANLRTCIIRVGIVLAKEGGFIPEVAAPIKKLVGAALGSGKQYVSWIHIHDLCHIYLKAIQDSSIQGVYNAVAPNPVTNKELTQLLAKKLHRPILLPPVPTFALNLLFGEMASMLVANQKVSAEKIVSSGFQFSYPQLEQALDNLL